MAECRKCEGLGWFEMGGYDCNCDECKTGFDRETASMKSMVTYHKRQALRLKKAITLRESS